MQVDVVGDVIRGPWAEIETPLEPPGLKQTTDDASITDALALALASLSASELTEQSQSTMRRLWGRFARFAQAGHLMISVNEIDGDVVTSFVDARNLKGATPSDATRRHRRSAIRLLFKIWRDVGIVASDPTIDIDLPSRAATAARPLTDQEVETCRAASLNTPSATRKPAIWVLAESGVQSAEIPFVLASQVDFDARRGPQTGAFQANGDGLGRSGDRPSRRVGRFRTVMRCVRSIGSSHAAR